MLSITETCCSCHLSGALLRFRAHYNPKGLQLDPDGDVQPHTGPVITSFFVMLMRVYRIEGWPGLYKGLIQYPPTGVLAGYYRVFAMLIDLPRTIITTRSVTTLHKLPYFHPLYSLRILLTPTERRRPWLLYLTPGLLAAEVSYIAYVNFGLGTFKQWLVPELAKPRFPSKEEISVIKLAIYFIVAVASTIILTPLQVISVRLAIQRNHAAPEFNSISQEEDGDAEEVTEYSGAEEDVIGLRTEREPYTGLVDCAKRIIDEEGWRVLYRAWWLTLFGCLSGALAPYWIKLPSHR
ncbi:mitochondrial carrier [Melanogaster broomeanus]|nr:mitochondrial carrier [Melanogaster broomeanus]